MPTALRGEQSVEISVRVAGNTVVIDVSGEIDLSKSPQLRQVLLREIKEKHAPRVAINLSQVAYIDSSGVASLVEGLKASHDAGSRLMLIGVSGSARDVLQLSRLLKLFELYDSEEQALAS
jgi:anti-sigma B factor antagonist